MMQLQQSRVVFSFGPYPQWHTQRGDMGECPPRHGLKKFLAPKLQTDDCFATGVTRQTLLNQRKMCNFNVDFSKFFGGLCPQTPILGRGYWGGATAPLTIPHPLGASALRASLGTFGPSIVVSPGSHLTKILATRL